MKIIPYIFTLTLLSHSLAHALCLSPQEAKEVATVSYPGLKENSGIDFSNAHTGIFWTLNDGNKNEVFAIGIDGTNYGRFEIANSKKIDWEDIALAKCFHNQDKDCIYIADTGNNSMDIADFTVYVVEEPKDYKVSTSLPVVDTIVFTVNGTHEFEALAVNETLRELYFFSKNETLTSVFSLEKGNKEANLVTQLNFNLVPLDLKKKDKIITAADFDSASQTLLLGSNDNAFEIKWNQLANFKDQVRKIKVPKMKQTEAMAYYWNKGKVNVVATSEGKNQPLYLISCQ